MATQPFILANAFSLNMIGEEAEYSLTFYRMSEANFRQALSESEFVSAIGHATTAALLTSRLGIPVTANRVEVRLMHDTALYIAQVKGRLPEGHVLSEEEMQAVVIDYWLVRGE